MTNTVPQRPWFRATRTHGRFSAVPVAWQGWTATALFVLITVPGGLLLTRWLLTDFGGLAMLVFLPLLGLALWAFFRFVAAHAEITDLRQ